MNKDEDFDKALEYGNGGEQLVLDLLLCDGVSVLPTFDYKTAFNRAPMVRAFSDQVSPPDMDCFKGGGRFWVEVKRYGYSPWNRTLKANVHGIALRHYMAYIEIERRSGTPVFLAVVEENIEHQNGSREHSGVVLYARLAELTPNYCMCRGCQIGGRCVSHIPQCVYFRRDQFVVRWNVAHLLEIPA